MCLENFKGQCALIRSPKPTHLIVGTNIWTKVLYVGINMYNEINYLVELRKLTNLN